MEKNWYIGRYVLPGNVQEVVLKPKAMPFTRAAVNCPNQIKCPVYRVYHIGEVVHDATLYAEHLIEIAKANDEIHNNDILARLSQCSSQSGR